MRRTKSLWERMENHAIYHTKSRRRKPTKTPTANQVSTFDYVGGMLQAKWDRLRRTR